MTHIELFKNNEKTERTENDLSFQKLEKISTILGIRIHEVLSFKMVSGLHFNPTNLSNTLYKTSPI